MTNIYTLEQIKKVINYSELLQAIEQGFVLYSQGKVIVPPVGHLGFQNPPGDVHKEKIIELGNMITETKLQRQNDEQITVADLTGVAVQDIQIAKYVYRALSKHE
jgi:ornithine cyclodeaminase/alanine dehydrogenase-like protein (mu-crystallin family)